MWTLRTLHWRKVDDHVFANYGVIRGNRTHIALHIYVTHTLHVHIYVTHTLNYRQCSVIDPLAIIFGVLGWEQ